MKPAWLPCRELRDLLLPAFQPCAGFGATCTKMRWKPEAGHVPRGFCGATGALAEVELVLVVAEPGNPHSGEVYAGDSAEELLDGACRNAYECFAHGTDPFHRNVRGILSACWPTLSFGDQLRRAWITESVLCSAREECGRVPSEAYRTCADLYLAGQLELLPDAVVVALGGKAHHRMKKLGREYLCAGAVAPPGCNQRRVRESWKAIPIAVHERANAATR
jgi:hypothetical protein